MTEQQLDTVRIEPSSTHRASIIWLHGLGADGHDFEPIAKELNLPEKLGLRFVFPHAPTRPVTINSGAVMRAWYDIVQPHLAQQVDREGIRESQRLVESLVKAELSAGIPAERIIIAGFSQGGAIALEVGARHQPALAGIMALSTYVALPDDFPEDPVRVPVFMAHGTMDTVVPLSLAEQSRAFLESKDYQIEWSTYPMPHSVSLEEITAIREWLIERLSK